MYNYHAACHFQLTTHPNDNKHLRENVVKKKNDKNRKLQSVQVSMACPAIFSFEMLKLLVDIKSVTGLHIGDKTTIYLFPLNLTPG